MKLSHKVSNVSNVSKVSGVLSKTKYTDIQSNRFINHPTHLTHNTHSKRAAFTLAEVLITLGIIGVVAAITMPVLITNINERRNSERHANTAYKVTQAVEQMKAHGLLNITYDSTESFVNELQKYLKISKRCDKDHLTDCWPTKTITDHDGNEYNIADVKTGAKLHKNTDTNNVGLVLADGAPIILNYNNKAKSIDVGDPSRAVYESLPVGQGKSREFAYTTSATQEVVSFITDVNGKNNPNREQDSTGKLYDIRSFNGATIRVPWVNGDAGKILYIGQEYTPVNCTSESAAGDDWQYCNSKGNPSGYEDDSWAGAQKACKEQTHGKGSLPDVAKLTSIYNAWNNNNSYSSVSFADDLYWSSDEWDGQYYRAYNGMYVYIGKDSNGGGSNMYGKRGKLYVICVEN